MQIYCMQSWRRKPGATFRRMAQHQRRWTQAARIASRTQRTNCCCLLLSEPTGARWNGDVNRVRGTVAAKSCTAANSWPSMCPRSYCTRLAREKPANDPVDRRTAAGHLA